MRDKLKELIASLRERADVLDGGKAIQTCGIVPRERAKAFRQIAAELDLVSDTWICTICHKEHNQEVYPCPDCFKNKF